MTNARALNGSPDGDRRAPTRDTIGGVNGAPAVQRVTRLERRPLFL